MTVNDALRLVAGIMILISLVLAVLHDQNWLWFTAFIGANLLQSGLTKWCPMMTILKKVGLQG
jgi:hypothetical protein